MIAEQRDREIRALAISVAAMLEAGMFDEARSIAMKLRELVEQPVFPVEDDTRRNVLP